MEPDPPKPLWRCPACGRTFANRNQVHTCAAPGELDRHFEHTCPQVRATFDTVLAAVSALGPVQVLAEKTRIALHVRMSFAAFTPRRRWLAGHLVLARRIDHTRFLRIDTFSARNHVHAFRLASPRDVDEQFTAWLAEAYTSAPTSTCGPDPAQASPPLHGRTLITTIPVPSRRLGHTPHLTSRTAARRAPKPTSRR